MGWGASLIAEMHARGDHRGCRALCVAPREGAPERATGRSPGPRYRSKTEEKYAQLLDLEMQAGNVTRWLYEPLRLEIGPGAHYTPDFAVWRPDLSLPELHEVKGGFVREASRVRFRAAVRAWPCFRWFWCSWRSGRWTTEEVRS